MTAINDAVKTIKAANIKGIDNVYSFFVSEDKRMSTTTTDCLIASVGENGENYGSNQLTKTDEYIAVHMFYKQHLKGVDQLNHDLIRCLEKAGWRFQTGNGFSTDSDTGQPTTIFYFRRLKTWN